MRIAGHFSHLKPHVETFLNNCKINRKNVFVMMRYGDQEPYQQIEQVIRNALSRRGLDVHMAKDHQFVQNDMWANICVYMLGCDFGIGVYEEIDEREFNPNISIEVGFMLAQGKDCLLLKDQRMPKMPTDFCGHLYRSFDTYQITSTVSEQVGAWIKDLRAKGLL